MMNRYLLTVACLASYVLLSPAFGATLYTDDGEIDGLMETERWLVNRARFSPEQEADYYGLIMLLPGGHPDYDVCESAPGDTSFGTTTNAWAKWKASKPPCSLNARLTRSSANHALDMAIHETGTHTSPSDDFYWVGANHWDRQRAEGYDWQTTYGGNGALFYSAGGYAPAHSHLFVDVGVPSRAHRMTLISPDFREVGYGWATTASGQYYMSEDMALPKSGAFFFTGTIFHDANGNKVYNNGEGISGIEIRLYDNGVEGAWYDVSAGAGNVVIPINGFASNHTITVELVNKTGSTRDITIPTGWFLDRKVTLVNNEARAIGTFVRPAVGQNVGFRNLAQLPDMPRITTQPPTMLTQTSAVFNASLVCTGKTYGVSAYWGPSDGGTNAGSWAKSAYLGTWTNAALTNVSCTATGLTLGTDYYVIFRMTNATDSVWAKNTMSFTTLGRSSVSNSGVEYTVQADVVRLTGEIKDGPADATIFWGRSDGGTNAGSWEHRVNLGTKASGSYSCMASNVYYGQPYYYRCHVSNMIGVAWAPESNAFGGPAGGLSEYRINVAFTNYNRAEILTNFPVLVVLSNQMQNTDFSFKNFLSGNGDDLRFRDAADTKDLYYEIDTWSTGTCSYVWVQVPQFTNNSSIWVTWGDASDSNKPAYSTNGAAWSSQYRGVWHLGETVVDERTTGTHYDSTANRVNGTQQNNSTTAGIVGNAQFLDGAGDQINVAHKTALNLGSVFTYSGWFRYNGPEVNWRAMLKKGGWEIWTWGDTGVEYYINYVEYPGGNIVPSWRLGSWYYLTIVFNGTSGIIYRDGYRRATISIPSVSDNTSPLVFGEAGGDYWEGAFDEFRIETGVPSSNRVWATYMNMASNAWFNTVTGNVQTIFSPIPRSITNLAATSIHANDATLNARLDCSNAVYGGTAHWGLSNGGTNVYLWDNAQTVGSWTNSTSVNVSTIANALSSGDKYYYTFSATNREGRIWAPNVLEFTTLAGGNSRPLITEGDSISVTMSEDGIPIPFALTLHANDADGDPIIWSISSQASQGEATASGTGTKMIIGYTPISGYHGSDSFVVSVTDGISGSDTITVNVTIEMVISPPDVANGPVTTVSTNAVELTGSIIAEAPSSVWICWGGRDAGNGSTGAWDHVVSVGQMNGVTNFSTTVSNLAVNATYWFRCYATNAVGSAWSPAATRFSGLRQARDGARFHPDDFASIGTITGDSTNLTFNTDTGEVTPGFAMKGVPGICESGTLVTVFCFDSIALGNAPVIIGSRPIVIMSKSDLTISAGISVNGGNGAHGAQGVGVVGGFNGGDAARTDLTPGNPGDGQGPGGSIGYSGATDTITTGGGGYGGAGGNGDYASGGVYGSPYIDDLLGGSGAGGTYHKGGGAGGGAIELAAAGMLRITTSGSVSAKGGAGPSSTTQLTAGGGSGGSILLVANAVNIEGTVTVQGGNGGNASGGQSNGGGGGGGRIAVYYVSSLSTNAGIITIAGGLAVAGDGTGKDGASGTLYVGAISQYDIPGTWFIDFGLTNGTPGEIEFEDPDGDTLFTWQEYVAGTDPTNRHDAFNLQMFYSNGLPVVFFESRETTRNYYGAMLRFYTLEYLTNMLSTNWMVVPGYSNLQATGGTITYTNNTSTNLFYRAKVWIE